MPKFRQKNLMLSFLTENWHTWYLRGAICESRLRFFRFRWQSSFLGKVGPKKSKLSIFPENWHTWYIEDADYYSNISFLNFQPYLNPFMGKVGTKNSNLSILTEKWHTWYIEMLIFIPKLVSYAREVELPVSSDVIAHCISRVLICFIWNL